MSRAVVLAALFVAMWGLKSLKLGPIGPLDPLMLAAVGFVLLAAYTVSEIGNALRLPRVTGYILAGVVLGPSVANILSSQVVVEMRIFNTLALGLIASGAGLELDLGQLRKVWRTLFATVLGKVLIAVPLVAGVVLVARAALAPLQLTSSAQVTALALVLGVLSLGTSPAIVLAVLKETDAKGRMADLVLGAAVIKDLVVVVMLALTISVAKTILVPNTDFDTSVLILVLREIGNSIAAGAILGVLLIVYLRYIRAEMLLFVAAMILVVSELGRALHLEMLLVFITAGFVVRNFSKHAHDLFEPLSLVSLPVFVVFFTNAGAGVDLRSTWHILPVAVAISAVRALGFYLSARGGGAIGGEPEVIKDNAWLGYIPQAGVTLSLVGIAAQQLPELQSPILTMGMATVAVNLFVGPLALRHALRLPIPTMNEVSELPHRSIPSAPIQADGEVGPVVDLPRLLESLSDTALRQLVANVNHTLNASTNGFICEEVGKWAQAFGAEAAASLGEDRPIETNTPFLAWIKKPHHQDALVWGRSCMNWLGELRQIVADVPELIIVPLEQRHREPQLGDPLRVRITKRLASIFRLATFWRKRPARRVYARHIARVAIEPRMAELVCRSYAAWCKAAAAVFETQRGYASGLEPGQSIGTEVEKKLKAAVDAIQGDAAATVALALQELCHALANVGTSALSARDLRYSKVEPKVRDARKRLEEDPAIWVVKLDATRSACRVAADLARNQAALRIALEMHLLKSADVASQGALPIIQAVRERIDRVRQELELEPFPDGDVLQRLEESCQVAFAHDAENTLDRAACHFRPAVTIHNLAVELRGLVSALPEKVLVNRSELSLRVASSPRDVVTRTVNLREVAGQKLLRDFLPFVDERADESAARLAGAASRIRETVDTVHEAISGRRELVDSDADDNALVRQTVERALTRFDELHMQLVEGALSLRNDLDVATTRTFVELRGIATGEAAEAGKAEPEATTTQAWGPLSDVSAPMRKFWGERASRAGDTWRLLQTSPLFRSLRVRYQKSALSAAELREITRAWQLGQGVPDAYARLFSSDAVSEPRRFTANRTHLSRMLEAERDWLAGGPSGALVMGDHGSGKTSLLNMCELDVRASRVIRPQRRRVARDGGIAAAIAFELDCRPRDRDIIAHLGESRTTVLLDDLEQWLMPDVNGLEQCERLLDLIVRTSGAAFWAVTVTNPALRLLEENFPVRQVFGYAFTLEPLAVDELVQAVEARHALSSLQVRYPSTVASRVLNRFQYTSDRTTFFRILRRISEGNLSHALAAWVRCVTVEEGGIIHPQLHRAMSLGLLSLGSIGVHETSILIQTLRFGPLHATELAHSLHVRRSEVDRYVAFLEAAGLLERGGGAHGELRIPLPITVPVQHALRIAGVSA